MALREHSRSDSGEIKLSKRMKERCHALREIVQSEQSYVEFLEILWFHLYMPLSTGMAKRQALSNLTGPDALASPRAGRRLSLFQRASVNKNDSNDIVLPADAAVKLFPANLNSIIAFN